MDRFWALLLTRVTPCRGGCTGGLRCLLNSIFLRTVTAVVHASLLLGLLDSVWLLNVNLPAQ